MVLCNAPLWSFAVFSHTAFTRRKILHEKPGPYAYLPAALITVRYPPPFENNYIIQTTQKEATGVLINRLIHKTEKNTQQKTTRLPDCKEVTDNTKLADRKILITINDCLIRNYELNLFF